MGATSGMLHDGVRGVVFDAFGTLVEITNARRPFRQLYELAGSETIALKDYATAIMCSPFTLATAARRFTPAATLEELERLEHDLEIELGSIRLFPEVESTLRRLREAGLKIAICSNLAAPYAEPVKRLLPFEPDALSWSFEVGVIKPDSHIYLDACARLGQGRSSLMMVGDKELEDYEGPTRIGMKALRLRRSGDHREIGAITSISEILRGVS